MTTWITDAKGNKCSVEYFGSEDKAREALASLKNCTYCTNCANCSDCSDCSNCANCSDCYSCSNCSDCYSCLDCHSSSNCICCHSSSNCMYCTYCSGCSNCSNRTSIIRNSQADLPFTIPKIENIHQTIYAAVSVKGALDMRVWHTFKTTHCRAGWVVTLAGADGKALEERFNTFLAALMIYRESGSSINPGRFFDNNEDALADMKRLAEAETDAHVRRT